MAQSKEMTIDVNVPPLSAHVRAHIITLNEFPMHADLTNDELSIEQAVN